MNVVEELMDEQVDIQVMVNVLSKLGQSLAKGDPIDKDQLNQTLKFFNLLCNKCHTKKLDEVLLVAMQEGHVNFMKEPAQDLVKYQDNGGHILADINAAAELYLSKDDQEAAKNLSENIEKYIDNLAHQFDAETHHIYGLANRFLTQDKRHELVEKVENLEKNEECNTRHAEFRQLITQYQKANPPYFRRLDHFEYPCSYPHRN